MRAWSEEDEQRLLRLLREANLTPRLIAQKLGRTEASVNSRLILIRKRTAVLNGTE